VNLEPRIRLLIVDDHAVVREGLEAMLSMAPEISRIATAGDCAEALAVCGTFHPDVVLLDLRLPGSDGFQVLDEIRRHSQRIRVLMLSSSATAAEVALARQRGASGYLEKSVDRATLLAAIGRVAAGGSCFFRPAADRDRITPDLSPRELEVLSHLGRGLGNEDLGLALGVSGETIKSHLKAIFQKLGVSCRAEAVSRGYELGLLTAVPPLPKHPAPPAL
jgi:DNA-binding NarL/FixJ family response regulator